MEHIQTIIATYGYFAIFALLFFGICGIPSPEETLMIFVGVAISQGTMDLYYCILSAFLGVVCGMLCAYIIGRKIGQPFLIRFGKYIGLTEKRWEKASVKFEKYAVGAVAFGYFIPGVRQINPYLSGISQVAFLPFAVASIVGAAIWTTTFILLGDFMGNKIEKYLTLTPAHIAIALGFILILLLAFTAVQFFLFKRQTD